ncbi:CerR family C-terminal domain-containing protein [Paucibacter sp. APW11]|uniref:CerR family C-terminal domain-containing protein n=1 Tax=Roseateles aquae TaxID=3077235 RepID=A0ABU3PH55_9BURK|nr:CerR family C-terminal domain-containing protein [Paucibacter sp. APW11]MDT9001885.1 CerR family C-terminal domain-containing protein [Paucibacter sp. APW11]
MAKTSTGSELTRSEQTRQKLLLATLEVVGEHGYELATTRMLAARAGVNLAAIPYHFASKEELVARAAEFLAEQLEQRLHQPLLALQAASEGCTDRGQLIDMLVDFMLAQARAVLAGDVPASWVQFFLRSQAVAAAQPGQGSFTDVLAPSRALVQALIGRIVGRPAQDFVCRSLGYSLFQQVLYFRVTEGVLLQHLGRQRLSAAAGEELLRLTGISLRAQLAAHSQS